MCWQPGRSAPLVFSAVLALLLLTSHFLSACEAPKPAVDHMAVARDLAAQIEAREGQKDYSSPAWGEVSEELQLVPDKSADKAEAEEWRQEIDAARRAKLFAVTELEGGSQSYQVKNTARASNTSVGFPPPPDRIDVNAISRRVSGSSSTSSKPSAGSTSTVATSRSGPVIIYTTSWCGGCKQAKEYMRSKGISFIETNVASSAAARAEKDSKAPGSGVPVLDVKGQILVGFDAAALDGMLK